MAAERLRVLCADDNRDAADESAELLRLVGFDAVVCYDGPGALSAAGGSAPDVCLLDLHLPGIGGDDLAGRLRAQAGERPVLMIAATARVRVTPAAPGLTPLSPRPTRRPLRRSIRFSFPPPSVHNDPGTGLAAGV
jgi:CheY-like chemotaxis protein